MKHWWRAEASVNETLLTLMLINVDQLRTEAEKPNHLKKTSMSQELVSSWMAAAAAAAAAAALLL